MKQLLQLCNTCNYKQRCQLIQTLLHSTKKVPTMSSFLFGKESIFWFSLLRI